MKSKQVISRLNKQFYVLDLINELAIQMYHLEKAKRDSGATYENFEGDQEKWIANLARMMHSTSMLDKIEVLRQWLGKPWSFREKHPWDAQHTGDDCPYCTGENDGRRKNNTRNRARIRRTHGRKIRKIQEAT